MRRFNENFHPSGIWAANYRHFPRPRLILYGNAITGYPPALKNHNVFYGNDAIRLWHYLQQQSDEYEAKQKK